MSRSSSLMGSHPSDQRHKGNRTGEVGVTRPPPHEELLLGQEPERYDVTGIEPSMMPAFTCSSSSATVSDTLSSKLWNGAMPTPSFSSVPMYGVKSNSSSLAADMMDS